MPYENAAIIPNLNPDYPLGSDPIAEGDNHIRSVKESLLTFYNNNYHVVLSHTLREAGFNLRPYPESFETGGTLESAFDVLLKADLGLVYSGVGPFPQAVAAGTIPDGNSSFVDRSGIARGGIGVNIRSLGVVGNGIEDDSDTFIAALAQTPSIIIDEFTKIRITKEVFLPLSTGFVCGGGSIILDGTNARIRMSSNIPSPVAIVNGIVFDNESHEIALGADYTGKYIFLENLLPWFIETAANPGTPAGSMDPFGFTGNDNNFLTERKGVYKVVGHNSVNGKSILNMPTNFNATGARATIYNAVNHAKFDNIKFSHINRGALTELGSISLSGCFDSGFNNCTMEGVGAIRYYWLNSRCYLTNCKIRTDGGVWISVNSRQCNVTGNQVDHAGASDGAVTMYYNACENVVTGNTITSFKKPEDTFGKWGIITHSASDYNVVTGNVITSYSGVSDFFSNKGNVFSGNTINGQRGEVSNYCFDTTISGNTINNAQHLQFGGSKVVNIVGNTIRQYPSSASDMLFDLYDPEGKPFGFNGFFGAACDTLNIEGNTVIGFGRNVSVRTYITVPSGTQVEFNLTAYEDAANYCIGSPLCRIRKVNVRNNKISNFDCAILNYSMQSSNGLSDIKSQGNLYEQCDTMVAQAALTTSALKGISSSYDMLKNVNIACVNKNSWFYIRGCMAKEIDSIIVVCGDNVNLYATIVDVDCEVENEIKTFKHYDFSGQWTAYYSLGVIAAAKHTKCSNIPYGAQYYQISDNQHTTQAFLFINRMNTFDGSPGNVTIRRTITEQQYG